MVALPVSEAKARAAIAAAYVVGQSQIPLVDGDAARAEVAIKEGLETFRAQSRTYADTAGHQLDVAQRYVTERVREKPQTALLAAAGVGLLLGLLLAGRGDRR